MKVLHVIPSVSPKRGGPSKAIIEMVMALRDQNLDVEIATTNDDGPDQLRTPLNVLTDYHGVPVRFFAKSQNRIGPIREFSFSNSFRRWLKVNIENYDLIHVHAIFSFTSSYALWLARKRGVPYVIRPIGQLERWSLNQSKYRKKVFLTLFEKRSLTDAAAIQFTADSEKAQAEAQFPELRPIAHTIPLSIELPELNTKARSGICDRYKLNPKHTVLLFLSRVHPKKGLELLLAGLSELESREWSLLIAGDGDASYLETLKERVTTLGIHENCTFVGFVSGSDKDQLLAGADLFALTSHSENFGIAALEALSHGTPALLSKDVALAKFVKQEQAGWVTQLSVSSIKAALEKALISSAPEGEKIRTAVIENFGSERISRAIIDLYQRILENNQGDN